MVSIFGSKVKSEHRHVPERVKLDGKQRAYDFEYSCVKVKNGKKYTVEGVITTDNLAHAKTRTKAIYDGLRDKIADGKSVNSKKLEKVVKKALHHDSDLKSIEITIKKKHSS